MNDRSKSAGEPFVILTIDDEDNDSHSQNSTTAEAIIDTHIPPNKNLNSISESLEELKSGSKSPKDSATEASTDNFQYDNQNEIILIAENNTIVEHDQKKNAIIENKIEFNNIEHENQNQNVSIAKSSIQISEPDSVKISSIKRNDPYSGYDNSKPSKKRTRKRKQNNVEKCFKDSNTKWNDVIVKYTRDTMPSDMQKYYSQRYDYFSKFDEGILMDKEGWFSVTPEWIAMHIANRCQSDIIIDAFCGCGGNSIQFAMTCNKVIAIDLDPVKLHCARENAKIYGVENRIEFILGNFFELAPFLKADVVFLSPPWGGPSYTGADVFDLKSMIPGDGTNIFQIASNITPNVAYFVPRNTDPQQLARLAGPGNTCEIEINYLYNRPKALTVYYGNLIDYERLEEYEEEELSNEISNIFGS